MRFCVLAFAVAAVSLSSEALAQGPGAVEAAALHRLGSGTPVADSPAPPPHRVSFALPDSVKARRKDYTVPGLLIGAGLGFAGGWAFYDLLCEAVDNECGESRYRMVVPASALGGLIGAAIGTLAE
jgi:hypothetical protein